MSRWVTNWVASVSGLIGLSAFARIWSPTSLWNAQTSQRYESVPRVYPEPADSVESARRSASSRNQSFFVYV
jgi:hypothetical protein